MTIHLVKLCVGAEGLADLQNWQARLLKAHGKVFHTTRMVPKRVPDLLEGGSLYWVIKRQIRVRQQIIDVEDFMDDGIRRCHLHLHPELVLTRWQARRAFQGWRYLRPEDAPADAASGTQLDDSMPQSMRDELAELGLI